MPDLRMIGRTHLLPSSDGSITLRDYEVEEPSDSFSQDKRF